MAKQYGLSWRGVFLKTTRSSVSKLSSRTQCGDLLAMRLLPPRLLKASVARGRLTFRLCKKIFQGSQVTRTADKKKNSCQTILSKIKALLKLSSKSVGQGRGGLEGTVRPSQLRAGSPPKKRIPKKRISKNKIKSSRT